MTTYDKTMAQILGLSLGVHLFVFILWGALAVMVDSDVRTTVPASELQKDAKRIPQDPLKPDPAKEEISQLILVETEVQEPVKKTKFFGKHSTRAANTDPEEKKAGDLPKLVGDEKRFISATESVPDKTPAEQLQPPAPPVTQKPAATPKPPDGITAPKPAPKNDLALVQHDDLSLRPAQIDQPTVSAKSPPTRVASKSVPSILSDLPGSSVERKGRVALDVKGSPFGAYDELLQEQVSRRWRAILAQYFNGERTGVVTIFFKLHRTGRIEGLEIRDNTAGEVLGHYCKQAIDDSTFPPFPDGLPSQEYRDIIFTFYY